MMSTWNSTDFFQFQSCKKIKFPAVVTVIGSRKTSNPAKLKCKKEIVNFWQFEGEQ